MRDAKQVIVEHLKKLGISTGSQVYGVVVDQAFIASEVMTKAELRVYIAELIKELSRGADHQ